MLKKYLKTYSLYGNTKVCIAFFNGGVYENNI